jgi:sucrose phosphorylase
MGIENKINLITYPDSLGKNLVELHYVLRRYLMDVVGGVHLLPFYPSSADRGFSPLTYDEVDPAFGTWDDVDIIGRDFDLTYDFMVNHISRQSVYFKDYIEKGANSEYADMFLTFNKLSPTGEIDDETLSKVYTRKPRPPYTMIQRADGSREKIWCTFDYEQIDYDLRSPKT